MGALRWVRPTEALVIGLSGWLLFSCTSDTSTERTATTSSALNSSPSIGSFALYAERSVKLASFDMVTGGDVGVAAGTLLSFGDQLVVGDHAQITETNNLLAPSVTLGSKSQVGDVETNTLHNDGAISFGTVTPYPALSMPPLPIAGNPAPSTSNITVGAHEVTTLLPGAYGALAVGDYASVLLSAGTYSFASVSIGDHVQTTSDPAGVTLLVSGTLSTGGWDQIAPANGATADKLVVLVGGIDAAGGASPAAAIGVHAQATALIAAPHGTLAIADHAQLAGAFAAFDLALADHAQVTYQSGFSPTSLPAQQGTQQLHGYVKPPAAAAPLVGPVDPSTVLFLAFTLPNQHESELETFAQAVSDPTSPKYRQFLSASDYDATYGGNPNDYVNLQGFAMGHGFAIDTTFPDNLFITITAPAAAVEQALYVNLYVRQRADGTTFYTLDRDPSLDFGPAIFWISGLDNYVVSQPAGTTQGAAGYMGQNFRDAYIGTPGSPCQSLWGDGQIVGIYAEADFNPSDIQSFISEAQSINPPLLFANVNNIKVTRHGDITGNQNANGVGEITTDVEAVISMAPAATVVVFEDYNSDDAAGHNEMFEQMRYRSLSTVTNSWFEDWDPTTSSIVRALAVQGVSFFEAAGDFGGFWGSQFSLQGQPTGTPYNMPQIFTAIPGAAQGWATMVGGTSLTLAANPSGILAWSSETAWPQGAGGVFSGLSAGASILELINIPDYQKQVMNMPLAGASLGSQLFRNIPDVSAQANGMDRFLNGGDSSGIGTSFASPLWAGFMALADEQSEKNGLKTVGFANPVMYAIGATAGVASGLYYSAFNDITSGTNNAGLNGTNPKGLGFPAVQGYDLATGLGSPTCTLLNQLASGTPLVPVGTALPTPTAPLTMAISYGCAIVSGAVQCWGENASGQLGNGTTNAEPSPVCVQGLPTPPGPSAVSVDAGTYETCALLSDGTAWCWGENGDGQLGLGTATQGSLTAQQVHLPQGVVATTLSAGPFFACVTAKDGTVWCWGLNDFGQLGHSAAQDSSCSGSPCSLTPQAVAGVTGALAVTTGTDFACALTLGGAVTCWGANDQGQLGNGSVSATGTPGLVVTAASQSGTSSNVPINNAVAVTAGDTYACAALSNGATECWGSDDFGQLGNEDPALADEPAAVFTYFNQTTSGPLRYLAAGIDHTCNVQSDGSVWCAGDNDFGDLGVAGDVNMPEPNVVQVQGLAGPAIAVATGIHATCVMLESGGAECWGESRGGQLGDGTTNNAVALPMKVALTRCF